VTSSSGIVDESDVTSASGFLEGADLCPKCQRIGLIVEAVVPVGWRMRCVYCHAVTVRRDLT